MNVSTEDNDYYEDVAFVSMEHGWLSFEMEDAGTIVLPVSTVVELHFTDPDELQRFRDAVARSARLPVWMS